MIQKHTLIKSTVILTTAGMISRIIGFFYRIFLSRTIGAEGIGIYQMIFPVHALLLALSVSGIQTAISRFVSARSATGDDRVQKKYYCAVLFFPWYVRLLFLPYSITKLPSFPFIFCMKYAAPPCYRF